MPRKIGKRTPSPGWNSTLACDPETAPKILSEITWEDWIATGERASTESSCVQAIAYDAEKMELYVWFHQGTGGKYTSVDEYTAKSMFGANSMGRFVHQRLKSIYGYIRF